jgi:hypothetical protein
MFTKWRTPALPGLLEHVEGADDVGLPALLGVALEHGEVLEGRRVEDDVGAVPGEDPLERGLVADVAEHEVVAVEQAGAVEQQLHSVQRRLVAVEQDEAGRAEQAHLPWTARSRWSHRPR